MTDSRCRFVWYELLATDPFAAKRFYSDVVGWTFKCDGSEDKGYRYLSAPDGERIGGLTNKPLGMPGGSLWLSYVSVDDVDESVKRIKDHGGAVHLPAFDIDGIGRVAMVADVQGAAFYVMQRTGDHSGRPFVRGDQASPGYTVWNELTSRQPQTAIDFYARVFGWRQEGSMPMGTASEYRFIHAGSECLGGVQEKRPGWRTGWQSYFMVADLDAAVARLQTAGGKVVLGPDDFLGGGHSLIAEDAQGARFGLVG